MTGSQHRQAWPPAVTAVTAVLASLLTLLGARPALASCAEGPPRDEAIAAAPIVFVGTAVAVEDGVLARFRVEEVWAGDDLVEVTVRTGEGPGLVTSVDRSFEEGQRYLVVPYADGASLRDNACTPTEPWSEELEALRPADARIVPASTGSSDPTAPDPAASEPGDRSLAVTGTAAAVALLAVAGLALFARRRRGDAHAEPEATEGDDERG